MSRTIDRTESQGENGKKKEASGKRSYFRMFVSKYTLWGGALIVFGILIDLCNESLFILEVLSNLLTTVGIALLIGAIFDFARNGEDFTAIILKLLQQIVVSRDFLGEISESEKKKALELIIKPTDAQVEQCSSIEQYYAKSFEAFTGLYKKPFKTNVTILLEARVEDEKVICAGDVSSRRYKTDDKYQPISTTFEKESAELSRTYILLPTGEKINVDAEPIEIEESSSGEVKKKYVVSVPELCNQYPYITIYKTVREEGFDHWITFNWLSLTPCDGICFKLICKDDLVIKEHKIFDNPGRYNVSISPNREEIMITSSCWLDEYTGFTLTISKKEQV